MQLLKKVIHPHIESFDGKIFKRVSARGVIEKNGKILLMYTKRYNDYTFPGGGVDSEEHLHEGLKRELLEETGAVDVKILKEIGFIEDFRSHPKEDFDLIQEFSYFYLCKVETFSEVQLEDYEIKNGMEHVWIDINEAIAHNKKVIEEKAQSLGLSIVRETDAMEIIRDFLNNL